MSEAAVSARRGVLCGLVMLAAWLGVSFVAASLLRDAPAAVEALADCIECATTGYVPCSAAPKSCPLCSTSCCSDGNDKCCCIHSPHCTCVPPPTRGPG